MESVQLDAGRDTTFCSDRSSFDSVFRTSARWIPRPFLSSFILYTGVKSMDAAYMLADRMQHILIGTEPWPRWKQLRIRLYGPCFAPVVTEYVHNHVVVVIE